MDEREKKLNDLLDNLNDKLDKALALKARQKMGMSIDEDIEMLEYIRQDFRGCRQGVALQDAINIMRKYQKIQEIVNTWNNTGGSAEESDILDYIEEVIEDGNNN